MIMNKLADSMAVLTGQVFMRVLVFISVMTIWIKILVLGYVSRDAKQSNLRS